MTGSRLDRKIFDILNSHPKVVIAEQTIRNEISKIRSDHPGVTMNAAAALFAKKRNFSIMRNLSEDDKRSLKNTGPIVQKVTQTGRPHRVKVTDISLSFGKTFIKEANSNAQLYHYVYILENSLRQLILNTFGENTTWWDMKVPRYVKEYAQTIQEAEKKHDWLPKRGCHPIYYVGLNELAKIIIKNHSCFKKIFTNQHNFKTWIDESIPIRNCLAHNVLVKGDDRQYFKTRCRYICNLIEKYQTE